MENNKPIVMVVDDQIDFVEGVKLILEEEGYDVWTAANGQQALDKLLENVNNAEQPQAKALPDLILADIMMPIMDGYELYNHTQANPHLSYIPFIFLTAKTGEADLQHGKELGVEDYLTKPCVPDVLLASVRGQLKETAQPAPARVITEKPETKSADLLGSGITILIVLVGVLIILLGYWLGI